jgi:L-alanine-DL-glutamate epimerase-like enolase superfamily enzyme
MRVGRVEAFAVRYPEPNNDGRIRALTLVRVETDAGLVGWGEAITGGQETSLAVAFVVERRLAPLVVGHDPRNVAGVWSRLRDATYWDGNGGLVTQEMPCEADTPAGAARCSPWADWARRS